MIAETSACIKVVYLCFGFALADRQDRTPHHHHHYTHTNTQDWNAH